MSRLHPLFACVLTIGFASFSHAEIDLVGVGTIPGDQSDLSGLTGKQSDGTPNNRLGGHGSAIAYTGNGNAYILASDRGPIDGGTDCLCRFHTIDIAVNPDRQSVELKLAATTLLSTENGTPLVGALDKPMRFDPEGVRVGPKGTVFISDEYGPSLFEFDRKGKRLRSFAIPSRFLISRASKNPVDELPPKTTSGRQPNRGMEALAISPDGGKLIGMMQSPLIQDGALDKENKRIGFNCRILEIDRASGRTREFVYPLADPANGVSEILAVNDHEFLVLERDSKKGKDAGFKKLFLIDLVGATDVSGVAELPSSALPSKVIPVKKSLFLDMLDSKFKLVGDDMPEKLEGLAFGPDLPDGRHLLLVTADNDFVTTVPFRVYAFAVGKDELPKYQAQKFAVK